MKKIFFTVGPSQVSPLYAAFLQASVQEDIASLSHKDKKFESLFSETVYLLKMFLGIPQDYEIYFINSATEAMVRVIENTTDSKIMHYINGEFSQRFYDTAHALRKKTYKKTTPWGTGFTAYDITEPGDVEAVCFTHNETSTGVMLSEDIFLEWKKTYPNTLLLGDVVSSAPYFNFSPNLFDCLFFSVQKGFGLPPGLCVLIVSPHALEKAHYLTKKGKMNDLHHSFLNLHTWAKQNQTTETPSVLHIYLLHHILRGFIQQGTENIKKETERKADLLYRFFAKHPRWSPFVKEQSFHSPTTLVMHTGKDTDSLCTYLEKHNIIMGKGYGPYSHEHIRIGNFPAHTVSDVETLCTVLEQYTQG